ncbi:hypothetical protein AAZX31_18G204000 [Glycine max]|nr:hypothetical protein JHK86_051149 [Glycine max]KAG4937094.1 hypothetical protein JHK85_052013 [Glycine max]KAG5092529.1 hypothetical protein JHK82_051307 [Glycine max]KAG5095602.1 hypothetical protein JHK84_051190 [Glycine max]
MMEEAGRPNVADFFPILRPLDPQRVLARRSIYVKKLFEIIDGIIEECVQELQKLTPWMYWIHFLTTMKKLVLC